MNPRKRKQRIREALQKAAEGAQTEKEQELVRRAAAVALSVGKLTQEDIDNALASIQKEQDHGEKKQTTDKTTKKTTKKRTTGKPSTKKRTAKKRTAKIKK